MSFTNTRKGILKPSNRTSTVLASTKDQQFDCNVPVTMETVEVDLKLKVQEAIDRSGTGRLNHSQNNANNTKTRKMLFSNRNQSSKTNSGHAPKQINSSPGRWRQAAKNSDLLLVRLRDEFSELNDSEKLRVCSSTFYERYHHTHSFALKKIQLLKTDFLKSVYFILSFEMWILFVHHSS